MYWGQTVLIVWTGPTQPSSWWESVHWLINSTRWEWSTSPSCSLILTVWGNHFTDKNSCMHLSFIVGKDFSYVRKKTPCNRVLQNKALIQKDVFIFLCFYLCCQVVWGAVWGPWRHFIFTVWRLSAGSQGKDVPEDRSLDAALQRHHADAVTILQQCFFR